MRKILPFLLFLLGLGGITGCRKQPAAADLHPKTSTMQATAGTDVYAPDDGPTVLGQQWGNPYLTVNMESARKSLESRGIRSASPFAVRTTHLYIACYPKNEAEYDVLTADESVDWYDVPLDYEKKVVGNWYRAAGIDDDVPTPQYAAVPVDYKFIAGIDYKVLGELYLPEQDRQLRGEALTGNTDYFNALVTEAHTLTLNAPSIDDRYPRLPDNGSGDYSGGYAAPGKIQVFDTRLNRYIPLEGVKVSARVSMFTTYHAITDAAGEYFLDGFVTGSADYAIHFQRAGFSVKRNRVANAYISRVNQPGSHWSYGIEGGRDRMHAHMFRAGFRYYYGDIADLPRPGRPQVSVGLVSFDVNQGLVSSDGHKAACFDAQGVNLLAFPTLFVARYSDSNNTIEYGSDEIFSTTVHEIAHTSHYNTLHRNMGNFAQVGGIIRESFAVGVEWLLTSMEYRNQGILNYGDWTYCPSLSLSYPAKYGYQYWNKNIDGSYTNLFIDLIDDFNEFGNNFNVIGVVGQVQDNVRNYRLGVIQLSILSSCNNISTLKTKLKISKPIGVTDSDVDELLNQY